MLGFKFKDVFIESVALDLPPHQVNSSDIEEQLSTLYQKLGIPVGTLEKLSGVASRFFYDKGTRPSQIATQAANAALENIDFPRDQIGLVVNCSVTRDFFEPATALLVHRNLGFPETVMALDVTNACIGFSNGMLLAGNMIESGVIKAALIVTGENLGPITDATMRKLTETPNIDRGELLKMMPTFTLGSGGAAMVLCHRSIATTTHQLVGSVARSASEHNELCIGNGDFCFTQDESILNPIMSTDSQKLMSAAAKLGGRMWKDAKELLAWSEQELSHIFCHQVGKQVNGDFYKTMGLPIEKEHTVYQQLGNLVSAALPAAFFTAIGEGKLKQGEKVLLTAFGSGLNSIFTGIVW